jgi:hypothetical protein
MIETCYAKNVSFLAFEQKIKETSGEFRSNFMENFSFPVIILKILQIQTGLEK